MTRIALERPRPTPAPTPRPTPRVTPKPRVTPVPHARRFPRVVRAAPKLAGRIARRRGGKAAPHHPIPAHIVPRVRTTVPPRSLANGPARGVRNGGAGTGAGAGVGVGGNGGSGAIDGTGGIGNGDADGSPCGEVTFTKLRERHDRDGRVIIDVAISVSVRGGVPSVDQLGWPFVYPSEAAVPFTHPDLPMLLQFPPPGYDLVGRQKPATATAVTETAPNGLTKLHDCPDPATP